MDYEQEKKDHPKDRQVEQKMSRPTIKKSWTHPLSFGVKEVRTIKKTLQQELKEGVLELCGIPVFYR